MAVDATVLNINRTLQYTQYMKTLSRKQSQSSRGDLRFLTITIKLYRTVNRTNISLYLAGSVNHLFSQKVGFYITLH